MKPVFIFDVGGVLVDWNPRHLYRKIFSSEKEMEYFLAHICPPAWNETLDAGRPFKEACDEKIAKYPQYKEAIDAYRTRWQEMISGPVAGTAQIVYLCRETLMPAASAVFGLSPTARRCRPVLVRLST